MLHHPLRAAAGAGAAEELGGGHLGRELLAETVPTTLGQCLNVLAVVRTNLRGARTQLTTTQQRLRTATSELGSWRSKAAALATQLG